jgi:ribosomal protein S18 acetylase RimI-like enzyme
MNEEIHLIEEALLNSIPAMQTVLLDGWVVRLNKNYTYRADCACPLRYTAGVGIDDKIRFCEELFITNKLPSVFKVTPVLQEGLADILLSQNYQNIKIVKVMRCKLENVEIDDWAEITCMDAPDSGWLAASAKLSGIVLPELIEVHCQNLKNIAVKSVFVEAFIEGKVVGCGYGTVERGYVGVYDLHVEDAYRCRGVGTAICRAIFRYGIRQNAKYAYLIVHNKNQNAISLYSHMGFTTFYEYSFYCKPHPFYKIVDA